MTIQNRKINLKKRKATTDINNLISYVNKDASGDEENNLNPLYQFVSQAAKNSKLSVKERVKQAAKDHTTQNKKLDKRNYVNRLLK